MTAKSYGFSPASIETLAGFSAGVVSTLVVHPLDIIKTRLQLNAISHSHLGSTISVARSIFRNEGSVRGFYRGLTPNLLGNAAGWSLYFLWYKQFQDALRKYKYNGSKTAPLTSLDYLATSASAGLLSAVLTNPIWVIKTRMLSTSASHAGAYPSMLSGLRSILREESVRGYFRGLLPALVGVSNGAVYFVAYEKLKAMRARSSVTPAWASASSPSTTAPTANLTNTDYLFISALSKIFAGSLTYPHQVLRARLQAYQNSSSQHSSSAYPIRRYIGSVVNRADSQQWATIAASRYAGVIDVIRKIWHNEGFAGFYKGLAPNLIRVVPSTCVTFLVYENTRRLLAGAGT